MNISATICEYNPYHNGHKYLAEYAREQGAEYFIGIMSGNVVQRGEFAVADKFLRADAAVKSGVDLIIELPCIYSLSSAEGFASGAVKTLNMCGCIDNLYFGAEKNDIKLLRKTANAVSDMAVQQQVKKLSENGFSHPRALHMAVKAIAGEKCADILREPNNTLAVEYLRALDSISSSMEPVTVRRKGVGHDSEDTCGEFASASLVRERILSQNISYGDYIPKTVFDTIETGIKNGECPTSIKNNDRGFMQALRRLSLNDWKAIPLVGEGLENRLYRAVKECKSVPEIADRIKCKRYTRARISRILMCAYLGITKELAEMEPQYIRVLAVNERGKKVLGEICRNARLPVIVSPVKDREKLSDEGGKLFELECRVSDLYGLFTPSVTSCGKDYTHKVFVKAIPHGGSIEDAQ